MLAQNHFFTLFYPQMYVSFKKYNASTQHINKTLLLKENWKTLEHSVISYNFNRNSG